MVELADGHVNATHAKNGANGTGRGSGARHARGTNGSNGTNETNGTPRKRIVVVGLGMVAVAFMYDINGRKLEALQADRHIVKSS